MTDFRTYIDRFVEGQIGLALQDTRVVALVGARQSGKSTLAKRLSSGRAAYVTFDDLGTLATAHEDPVAFVQALTPGSVIDEVQRVPEVLSAVKVAVDEDPRPGRFILTGSANLLTLPRISESLAGRMQVFTLFPLSQAELARSKGNFVDQLFGVGPAFESHQTDALVERVARGGYPEAALRESDARREAWFESYVTTMLQRDVREISAIEDVVAMNRLLRVASARTAGLLNETALSSQVGLPRKTLSRYLAMLEQLYLVWRLPAYVRDRARRMTKSPKLHLNDTGLAVHVAGVSAEHLEKDRSLLGKFVETFVANELRAQASWSRSRPALFHYRKHDGIEIDLVLEQRDGRVAAVEVKAAASLSSSDFSPLRQLAAEAGSTLTAGVLLYTGAQTLSFGKRLWAVPIGALWRGRAVRAERRARPSKRQDVA